MCRKMDVAIIKEKYRFNLGEICCQQAKDWKNFSDRSCRALFFIGRKNLYRCKRFFFSFENIPARKSFVAGKIRKKSMVAIESVVSFSLLYRAIEIPLSTHAQYSQIYLIISRLIFHKSVFIFLLRNDILCLVWNEYYILFSSYFFLLHDAS